MAESKEVLKADGVMSEDVGANLTASVRAMTVTDHHSLNKANTRKPILAMDKRDQKLTVPPCTAMPANKWRASEGARGSLSCNHRSNNNRLRQEWPTGARKRSWGDVYSASDVLLRAPLSLAQVRTPGRYYLRQGVLRAFGEGLSVIMYGHEHVIWKKRSGTPSKGHAADGCPVPRSGSRGPLQTPDSKIQGMVLDERTWVERILLVHLVRSEHGLCTRNSVAAA